MTTPPPENYLARFARRVEQDSSFMASALAAYRAAENLDDVGLAAMLGCALDDLPVLALCSRPDPASARFQADVRRIAAYVGVNPLALVRLLRAVDAAEALRGGIARDAGLLAARDREDETGAGEAEQPGREPEHT